MPTTLPTQNQMAIQNFHKWIEKIAANANTTELDALELTQLQRLLGTIIATKRTNVNTVSVLPTGLIIDDTMAGELFLTIPVTEVEGDQVFPPITVASWVENRVKLILKFIPNTNTTFGDVLEYILDTIEGFAITGFKFNYLDKLIKDYLDTLSTIPFLEDFFFELDLDFYTGDHKLNVFCTTGLPGEEVPGIGFTTTTNITDTTTDLASSYVFENTDSITEVGFEVGTSTETLTEVADDTTTSPFGVSLTELTANTDYIAIPYVKYATNKMQRGAQITFKTLES